MDWRQRAQELPLVSIISPSLNQGQFLEETILSVLSQDYQNIEYIIIDGGSTDGSIDIIRKYEDRLAYWVSEADAGQSDALNKGFRMARGDILGWIGTDDVYEPRAVSTAVTALLDNPDWAMVYGDFNYIDPAGRIVGTNRLGDFDLAALARFNFIVAPAAFMREKIYSSVGPWDTSLHFMIDYDVWLRICLRYRISHVAEVLANCRINPMAKNMVGWMRCRDDYLCIYQKFLEMPYLPKVVRCGMHESMGHIYLERRKWLQAFYHFAKSLLLASTNDELCRRMAVAVLRVIIGKEKTLSLRQSLRKYGLRKSPIEEEDPIVALATRIMGQSEK